MHIHGVAKYVVRRETIKTAMDHIFLFDVRKGVMGFGIEKRVATKFLGKEWNHVKFSLKGRGTESRLKYIGVYVYNYDSCKEDILFENPIPQERIQLEAVHKIGDSNLVSSSGDNIEEDDKLNKEIIDLAPKTVSNIEKKKGQLKVDDVNSTLSSSLPESSTDTTSHHDDKLNQEIMDPSTTAVSSIRKERKLEVDNEILTWDPMEWEFQLTREKDQSTIIGKGPSSEVVSSIKEKEINLEVDAVDRSSSSTLLRSSSDTCNILEKDQSTINDKGLDELGSHKAGAACFDLLCCLVSLCSSSAAS